MEKIKEDELPFPHTADELMEFLQSAYSERELVYAVKASHQSALLLAGKIELINELTEWQRETRASEADNPTRKRRSKGR